MAMWQEITGIWYGWLGAAWGWWASTPVGQWFTADATGQRVGLGLLLMSLLVAGWLMHRFGRVMLKRCRYVPTVLLAALGAYYASVLVLRLEPSQWAPAAAVAALTLLVLGLAATVAGRLGRRVPSKAQVSGKRANKKQVAAA